MLAQWLNSLGEVRNFLPVVSFIAGISGSLHCVGMCGGLVTASCNNSNDVFRYQTGRLLGYLFLGIIAGIVGESFRPAFNSQLVALIGALFIGLLFIYWGVMTFLGRKTELPLPKFLSKLYQVLWNKLVRRNENFSRSFFVGLISILLPCGLLYGVVIGTFALGNFSAALMSMLFFWLGTLPAMVMAPVVVQRVLRPLKDKLPKFYATTLILIGLATIYTRLPGYALHKAGQDAAPAKCHKCH